MEVNKEPKTICVRCGYLESTRAAIGLNVGTDYKCVALKATIYDTVTGASRESGVCDASKKNDGRCPDYEYKPKAKRARPKTEAVSGR